MSIIKQLIQKTDNGTETFDIGADAANVKTSNGKGVEIVIDTLDTKLSAHLDGTAGRHEARDVDYNDTTTVQDYLDNLDNLTATLSDNLDNFLPLEGGTITGDLRLKGSDNYGNKLNFGDEDYTYLYEDTDDHLIVHASNGITLDASNSGKNININTNSGGLYVDNKQILPVPRAADIVIAAYDATDEWKAGADYVCDGYADDVEINAAISALGTNGGKILLSTGTFYITSHINVSSKYFVLQGMGDGTRICTAAALSSMVYISIHIHSICKIKDLLFCNNSALAETVIDAYAKNLELENVNLTSAYSVPSSLGYTARSYDYSSNPGTLLWCYYGVGDQGVRITNCRVISDYYVNWYFGGPSNCVIDKLYLQGGTVTISGDYNNINIHDDYVYAGNNVTINVTGSYNKIYSNPKVTINNTGSNNTIC